MNANERKFAEVDETPLLALPDSRLSALIRGHFWLYGSAIPLGNFKQKYQLSKSGNLGRAQDRKQSRFHTALYGFA